MGPLSIWSAIVEEEVVLLEDLVPDQLHIPQRARVMAIGVLENEAIRWAVDGVEKPGGFVATRGAGGANDRPAGYDPGLDSCCSLTKPPSSTNVTKLGQIAGDDLPCSRNATRS